MCKCATILWPLTLDMAKVWGLRLDVGFMLLVGFCYIFYLELKVYMRNFLPFNSCFSGEREGLASQGRPRLYFLRLFVSSFLFLK